MKTTVKTVWGPGIVSVADVYVKEALSKGEGLEIECKGAVLKIAYDDLKNKTPRGDPLKDKFGRGQSYQLYDFYWKQ